MFLMFPQTSIQFLIIHTHTASHPSIHINMIPTSLEATHTYRLTHYIQHLGSWICPIAILSYSLIQCVDKKLKHIYKVVLTDDLV